MDRIATQESNTRIEEINGRNEIQCIGKQANFSCLESRMGADLVVAHTYQRRIREEATNTGKRKRCTLPLRQKIQHDHMRMMHDMARHNINAINPN